MPFNATTYRMNKYRAQAYAHLAAARDIRDRAAVGKAYDWELPRIASQVFLARNAMRLHLSYRALRDIEQGGRQ